MSTAGSITLCRQTALDRVAQQVPICLRERPQWVCWKSIARDGQQTKVPFNVGRGQAADSSDSTTWTSFEEVLAAYEEVAEYAGIGFVFAADDPFCGMDLDNCLNENGEFLWGREIVDQFDCYTEISPSGRGVKLFFRGCKPNFARCEAHGFGPDKTGRIEIYDRSRFFTVTGRTLKDPPGEVADRQQELDELCQTLWPPVPPVKLISPPSESATDCERRAVAYLEAMPPAISKQGGHNATYAAATALVHGFGIEPDRALQLLVANYNQRCQPPWSVKELTHKVQDAATKEHRQPFGWLRHADRFDLGGVDLSAFYHKQVNNTEVGSAETDGVEGGTTTTRSPDKATEAVRFQRLSCEELDSGDFTLEYLIERTLVRGQPCLLAGPKKSLKTSMLVDLGISLATGGYFLGYLGVNTACRVAIMSGESGLATLQETGRRVAAAKGLSLRDIHGLIWSPDLPRFGRDKEFAALHKFLLDDEIEVLCVDPAYLALPGTDAGNLFIQGELFREINAFCQEHGVTIVLAHHLRKNLVDPFQPPELEDIAWAGFQEWARQWLLIGRRQRFEPGSGEHRLWLNVGGSAGHSALWSLDVNEGVFDGFTPRRWEVTLGTADEARQEVQQQRLAAKDEVRQRRLDADREAILVAISRLPDCRGTKTDIRNRCGRNGQAFNTAFAELIDEGEIVPSDVTKENGKCYAGFMLAAAKEAES